MAVDMARAEDELLGNALIHLKIARAQTEWLTQVPSVVARVAKPFLSLLIREHYQAARGSVRHAETAAAITQWHYRFKKRDS